MQSICDNRGFFVVAAFADAAIGAFIGNPKRYFILADDQKPDSSENAPSGTCIWAYHFRLPLQFQGIPDEIDFHALFHAKRILELNFLGTTLAILRKDLRAEFRTKEVFNASLVFSLIVIVIFSLAFEPSSEQATELSGGLLWIAFSFSAVIALSRTFAREVPNDCMMGLKLAPISPAAVYLGKLISNMIFLGVLEFALLPLFSLLYNLRLWEQGGRLALIVFLGSWGLAAVGTSFAAVATSVRLREMMLPVLLFPVEIPLILSLVQATTLIVRGGDGMIDAQIWLKLCIGFDVVFTVVSLFMFEFILES